MAVCTIRWFDEIQPSELGLVGGKGLSLGTMVRASLPVPGGFVVTVTGYEEFVTHNALADPIAEAIVSLDSDDAYRIDETAAHLRAVFLRSDFPHHLSDNICAAYAHLAADGARVAVRSSATAEDLAGASFAGQHDSYLNVSGESNLLDAIRKCWSSLWSSRAISYRNTNNYPHAAVEMAVVVQRMVPAEVSGILFTANPLTGDRTEIVINASWGLGEAIVGGEVNPDTAVIDKATRSIKQLDTSARVPMPSMQDTQTSKMDTSSTRCEKISISHEDIDHLSALGLQIEAIFGRCMDIEWGICDGSVSILQARPITALPAEPLKWEAPGRGLWVHGGGIMEFQREPISPMTSSLIEDFFTPLYGEMAPFIRTAASWPAVRVVNGHLYSCLTYRVRPWHIPWVVQLAVQHVRSVSRWPEEREMYLATVNQIEGRDLASATAVQTLSCVAEVMRAFFRYYLHYASMVQVLTNAEERFTSFYKKAVMLDGDPEPAFLLQGLESRITDAEDSLRTLADELRSNPSLHSAVGEIAQSTTLLHQPAKATTVRGFQYRVGTHIATYGHQMYAFDFNIPTLGECPELIYGAILAAATESNDPRARRTRTRQHQELALARMKERLQRRKWQRLERLLSQARRNLQIKENAVFEIGRGIPLARACFLELGTRLASSNTLGDATDVFWLTWQELANQAQCLDGGERMESYVQIVGERRKRWRRFEGVDAPTFLPVGQKPGWWLSRIMPLPELNQQSSEGELRGVPVSPGLVTGTARVITDINEMTRIQQGEILVTDATTPAWTPFFARIGGLVTNRGGKLTHSSIVAREYGIPVVMGTVGATKQVKDGQQITVDGNRGIVRVSPLSTTVHNVETLTPV